MDSLERFAELLIDEIRAQPDLESEMSTVKIRGGGSELVRGLLACPSPDAPSCLVALESLWREPPRSIQIARTVSDILALVSGNAYDSKCRSALVYAFFGMFEDAKHVLDLAKNDRDDLAFAHHVYGLLLGLQGEHERARFELWIALEREPDAETRERIRRALTAMQ